MGMGRSRSQAGARPVSQPPTPGAGPLTVMVKMYSTKFHKGLLESAPKHSLGCRQLRRPKKEGPTWAGLKFAGMCRSLRVKRIKTGQRRPIPSCRLWAESAVAAAWVVARPQSAEIGRVAGRILVRQPLPDLRHL